MYTHVLAGRSPAVLVEDILPQVFDQLIWKRVQIDVELSLCISSAHYPPFAKSMKLTLNIILGIRIWRLVVMNHLDDLQKVLLAQLDQAIGQFLHINSRSLPLLVILLSRPILSTGYRSGLGKESQERLGGVLEAYLLLVLVSWREEIEVVEELLLSSLFGRIQVDGHIEFSPAFIFAAKGRGVECCEEKER